ncbi:MAG: Na+/H+ antiporter subunit E [Alphaproteobacteria bacterium]|nr:Na+/H+ antiporter subunit E [Alphaproteobacteria bacterium]
MRTLVLAIALAAFWLALSGHYTPFLISVGILCVLITVLVAQRMNIVDKEGQPIELFAAAPAYWLWLFIEIAKSAWSVTRVILDPRLPISPTFTKVRASQKTAAGMATYANSITLTPGTITTGVTGDVFEVHALVKGNADDLEAGGMDRRVSQFEGTATAASERKV